jgi:hypothetical protein
MVTRNAYLHFGLPRPAGADQAGNLALDLGEAGDAP